MVVARSICLLATLAFTVSAQYSNATTSASTPSASPVPGTCEYLLSACQSAPDANQAQCSAELAACKATTTCSELRDVCRTQPNANQAFCAGQEAYCNGLKANATTTAETTVYTTVCPATSVYTSGTHVITSVYTTTSTITSCKGGCPTPIASQDCEKVRSDCQSKPDANQATCAALYAQCAGTTSGLNKPPAATTYTTYTTVCPVTSYSTEGTKVHSSIYTTTSVVTAPLYSASILSSTTVGTSPAASATYTGVAFTGAGSELKAGSMIAVGIAALAYLL